MSVKILGAASVFVLGVGCYALFGTKTVNPVSQTQQLIELQKSMLVQLELQSVILTHIREDGLNAQEHV